MSAVRIGAAAALAGVAVLAALLAADVRSWPAALAKGDAVFAVAPGATTWAPPTSLDGLARSLLGVQPDLEQRRALQQYALAAAIPARLDTAVALQTQRAQAQTALEAVAASADPARASQARTLLGILAFDESAEGAGSNEADTAISDFTNAVRADPANLAAKFDLELMLRLTAAHGSRPGAGTAHSFGRGGSRGAGGGVPGSGY
ncbi:MAG: hypothetical protein KGL94_11310 [Acidobacteriota bacterium]|nr:hypothetical protein [Acidobacteriota bacterium]